MNHRVRHLAKVYKWTQCISEDGIGRQEVWIKARFRSKSATAAAILTVERQLSFHRVSSSAIFGNAFIYACILLLEVRDLQNSAGFVYVHLPTKRSSIRSSPTDSWHWAKGIKISQKAEPQSLKKQNKKPEESQKHDCSKFMPETLTGVFSIFWMDVQDKKGSLKHGI